MQHSSLLVEVGAADKRSYVSGGDEGEWRSQGRSGLTLAQYDPAPHEVGHLLGLDDRYLLLAQVW